MNTTAILENPEYFKCEPMRATIRKQVCRDRQEATRRNSEESCVYLSCQDCKQGKEIKEEAEVMVTGRIRGQCSNCERDGLMIQPHNNLCGSCQAYTTNVVNAVKRETLLAEAREKFKGTRVHSTGRRRKEEEERPLPGGVIEVGKSAPSNPFSWIAPETIDGKGFVPEIKKVYVDPVLPMTLALSLTFTSDDLPILEFVKAEAKRLRRTPDQMVLYILEELMGAERND